MNAIYLALTLVVAILILFIIQFASKQQSSTEDDNDTTHESKRDSAVKKRKKKTKKSKELSIESSTNSSKDSGIDKATEPSTPEDDRIEVVADSLQKSQFLSAVSLSSQFSSKSVEEEDGWIEVKKKKSTHASIKSSPGSSSNLNHSLNPGSNALTKKQRENQKKAQKIKEIKDIQRLEQDERLRSHRLNQMK